MDEIRFSVPGMTCGHCEQAVREELVKVAGVHSLEIDLTTKSVVVQGSALDRAALFSAVDTAGYEAVS